MIVKYITKDRVTEAFPWSNSKRTPGSVIQNCLVEFIKEMSPQFVRHAGVPKLLKDSTLDSVELSSIDKRNNSF